jgi:hypothetical protein
VVQIVYSGLLLEVEHRSGSGCLQWVVIRG